MVSHHSGAYIAQGSQRVSKGLKGSQRVSKGLKGSMVVKGGHLTWLVITQGPI